MNQHIIIEAVMPTVDAGRYAAKRVVGDNCTITADIYRDGHDLLTAQVVWRTRDDKPEAAQTAVLNNAGNDHWLGHIPLADNTHYIFHVEAWTDHFASWVAELTKKVEAGLQVPSEVEEGALLIEPALKNAKGAERTLLSQSQSALRAAADKPNDALAVARGAELRAAMDKLAPRADLARSPEFRIVADRPRAGFSSWYELFPRSQGTRIGKASTLREAAARLPDVRDMGFDVVYLPPIHPIGKSFRKGPNNSLTAGPEDPGSPWAIGSFSGGHTAVEPALGTIKDFDYFVDAARNTELEVALDFAIQCSPDHPWVKEHPSWFYKRPDGTIKYAENPPKKYQDVYHVNFDTPNKDELWHALLDILFFWIGHGVKIFRVDNPHTKPFAFWEWAIEQVQRQYPEVIFLSEAFTRPKPMKCLAKVGFTQSYTYFTWRNTKAELTEYMTELTSSGMQEYYRPNFWPNTPDILPDILQHGGRAAFCSRFVLAATLSPNYGIYSGYELCESAALPGREEYLDSEKYEVRVRDWNQPGNIKDLIKRVNTMRAENPALQQLANWQALPADNDNIFFYGKKRGENILLIAVNLDPYAAHECTVSVPHAFVDVLAGQRYEVVDLLTGAVYNWGEHNYVRLDPYVQSTHILRLQRRL